MSTRYLVVQQLGSTLRLPFADLERLDEVFGSARIDGVESIVLNPCSEHPQTFVPEQGTCHADETETFECVCDGIGHYGKHLTVHVMECSACGRTYEHVNGDYEYCPHCGRRVEKEDE